MSELAKLRKRYLAIRRQIDELCEELGRINYDIALLERAERDAKNQRRLELRLERENEALQKYQQIRPGDMVKVSGVKNQTFVWRQVSSVDLRHQTFDGIQYAYYPQGARGYLAARLNERYGEWRRGSQMTTNGIDKIVDYIPFEDTFGKI